MKQKIIVFQGQPIKTVKYEAEVYVSLYHLCLGVGVSISAQGKKVKANSELYGLGSIAQPTFSKCHKAMLMIPINRINTWLLSINVHRCRPEVRSTILHYQKECADALYDYWHKGEAINPRKAEAKTVPVKTKAEAVGVLESVVAQNKELIEMNREIIAYLSK